MGIYGILWVFKGGVNTYNLSNNYEYNVNKMNQKVNIYNEKSKINLPDKL